VKPPSSCGSRITVYFMVVIVDGSYIYNRTHRCEC
jgi:hypothetical protein